LELRRQKGLVDFLEAAYRLETSDDVWLGNVTEAARAVWGRPSWGHATIYDASDVTSFRPEVMHASPGIPSDVLATIKYGVELFTPAMVARTFRRILAGTGRVVSPELAPMFERFDRLGFHDSFAINGLDATGAGAFIGLTVVDGAQLSPADLGLYRRMAHHLGAAFRFRRRLARSPGAPDPTDGAEAVIDARGKVLHAAGAATSRSARANLVEATRARDRARSSRGAGGESLGRWRPLTEARWTLVDSYERGGARYVVARENQAEVRALSSLTERERQIVAYVAVGQSTKETGYALGISDSTVRVLLSRAAAKLGARSRSELLDHPEVRPLVPETALASSVPS
jgi:DNA-binding CsgD family transcriptional regulator